MGMAGSALCLDVGNSSIFAGLFAPDGRLLFTFRKTSSALASADEYGVFLKSVLRENGFDPGCVTRVAVSSVVPDAVYSLRRSCVKYFDAEPFELRAGVKTGLKVTCRNPLEVGSDRIANAIGAARRHPDANVVIVDMGTATSFDIIKGSREYLGNAIAPGVRIGMEALEGRTAKLPSVEIEKPSGVCGRSTIESIQAGLYFGHLGMVREILARVASECFAGERPLVIGTGGFSHLLSAEGVFDETLPDLVLEGLFQAMNLNAT